MHEVLTGRPQVGSRKDCITGDYGMTWGYAVTMSLVERKRLNVSCSLSVIECRLSRLMMVGSAILMHDWNRRC